MDHSQQRLRLQRSFSERPAPLRRSSSFFDLLGRVSWASDKDGHYTSSEEDELPPPTPPSPVVSMEEAKVSGVYFALSQGICSCSTMTPQAQLQQQQQLQLQYQSTSSSPRLYLLTQPARFALADCEVLRPHALHSFSRAPCPARALVPRLQNPVQASTYNKTAELLCKNNTQKLS